ncbi:hypothetical protein HOY80DRAFT_883283 [Tuber brumale]|nr:hypothetical protein HOY80DRAFT_883283 [Tuber brumale]
MKDNRWNTTALMLLRILQFALGVGVLQKSAYFVSRYGFWIIPYSLAVSVLTLAWVAVVLSLFFANKLLPLAVIIVDVILTVSYIVSIATIANRYSRAIGSPCIVYPSPQQSTDQIVSQHCSLLKSAFHLLIIQMLTFLGAIIWDGIVMYRNRNGRLKDVRASAQNAMHGGGTDGEQIAAIGGTYGMSGPMMGPENCGCSANGNHDVQTVLSQYRLGGFPIYPARIASPATPLDPHMQPHLPRTIPQQSVMTQHHQHQNHHQHHHHQQIHQFDQVQQQQYQHQHQQYQQNRGSSPQELDGSR